jgi:hypothetical protein
MARDRSRRSKSAAKNPSKGQTSKKRPTKSTAFAAVKKLPGLPHEVHDYLSRLSSSDASKTPMAQAAETLTALQSDAVAPVQLTDVRFDLDASTTATTHVHLQGQPDIVNNANPHGVLAKQVVGTFIHVVIEVSGNPDAVGVVDVQNAEPSSFQLKVSDGPAGIKPLFVTG